MADIIMRLHWDPEQKRRRPSLHTRVLGLTASLVNCKATVREEFERFRQMLIDAMQANIEPCRGIKPRTPPEFRQIDPGDQGKVHQDHDLDRRRT